MHGLQPRHHIRRDVAEQLRTRRRPDALIDVVQLLGHCRGQPGTGRSLDRCPDASATKPADESTTGNMQGYAIAPAFIPNLRPTA